MKLASFAVIAAAAVAVAFTAGSATATQQNDFTGYYDPANWTLDTSHNGFVDTSGAPASITVVGPDDGSGDFGWTDYFIVVPADGTFSFDWSYFSIDDPGWDAGFYINNGFFFLSDTSGESGSVSVPVFTGDIIGWSVETADNFFGPGELTITNFSAPIPEPATLGLLSGGLLLLARRRRN